MSALAAIITFAEGPSPTDAHVGALLARMTGRGPHHSRIVQRGDAVIGHALFQTLPEDVPGAQPADSACGTITVALDGRVDNRGELCALAHIREAGQADAAIVAEAVAVAGTHALTVIRGDFALLAWNHRTRTMLAARDLLGMRPLHIARIGAMVWLASDLRALVPEVPGALNLGALAEQLAGQPVSRTDTLVRAIARVAAGCATRIRAEAIDTTPLQTLGEQEPDRRTLPELHEEFRWLLDDAVRVRLRGVHAPAVLLSGGLDSTTVYGRARATDPRTTAWTVEQRPETSETAVAAATVRHFGGRHEVTPGSVRSFDYAQAARATLEPPPHPAAANSAALRARAARAGRPVLLNGIGGDEWFATHCWHCADLLARGRVLDLLRAWRTYRRATVAGAWQPLLQATFAPLVPRSVAPWIGKVTGTAGVPPWIAAPFARAVALDERLRARGAFGGRTIAARTRLIDVLGGPSLAANEDGERLAMLTGTEDRSPYFDRRIAEFSLRLPASVLDAATEPKAFVREACAGFLPESHRRAVVPFAFDYLHLDALEQLGGLAFFDDLVVVEAGYVDPLYLRNALSATWPAPAAGAGSSPFVPVLWHIASVETAVRVLTGAEAAPSRRAS